MTMILPPFRRLLLANLAAHGAEQLALTAIPLMAVLVLGASAATMGALGAAQTLPYLLFSLAAGLLADRVSRPLLLAASEGGRALLLLLLPLVAWSGWLDLPLLAAFGFALSACTVVFGVAAQAWLPALVGREQLAPANAALETTRAVAVFLGPGLAGAAVAWTSPQLALGVSAFTSLLAAFLLARRGLPQPRAPQAQPQRIGAALAEGLLVVWRQPLLRAIAACALAWNFSWFVLMAVFVLYAVGPLGLGPAQTGIALGAQGLGMVLAALAAPRIHRHLPLGAMILLGPAFSVAAALLVGAAALATGTAALAVLCAGFLAFGFGPMLWTIGQTSLRQAIVPARLLGRVGAVQQVATMGMRPLGALAGGLVGEVFGLHAAVWLAVAGFGLQFVIIWLSDMPGLRALPPPLEEPAAA